MDEDLIRRVVEFNRVRISQIVKYMNLKDDEKVKRDIERLEEN